MHVLLEAVEAIRARHRELRILGLPELVVHELVNAPQRDLADGPRADEQSSRQLLLTDPGSHSLTEHYSYLRQAWLNHRIQTRMSGGVRGRGLAGSS